MAGRGEGARKECASGPNTCPGWGGLPGRESPPPSVATREEFAVGGPRRGRRWFWIPHPHPRSPVDHGTRAALMKDVVGASWAVLFSEEEEDEEEEEAAADAASPWTWGHRSCRSSARASGPR